MKKELLIAIILFPLFISGCIEYSTYELRLDDNEVDINATSFKRIESTNPSDTVRFIFGGDAQRFYDQALQFVGPVNQLPGLQFVVFGGDVTDFGTLREFKAMHSIFSDLNVPYVMIAGNHDMIYSGKEIYQKMYGTFDFSFIYSRIKFIGINTNSQEFGFSGNVPDINWLEQELADSPDFDKAIVMCHVPPGNNDFDNSLEEAYASTISNSGKVILHLNSHNHNFGSDYPYDGSIHYITSIELKQRKCLYIKAWIGEDSNSSHSYEIIEF